MKTELTEGTAIYYGGDMANNDGFGTIIKIHPATRYGGEQIQIGMDDGRNFTVSPLAFSEVYLGHGGTRFVTKEAYDAWRNANIAQMQETVARLRAQQ